MIDLPCVHCAEPVTQLQNGDWIHVRPGRRLGLYRCQSATVEYGTAHPAGTPCRADEVTPCLGAFQ